MSVSFLKLLCVFVLFICNRIVNSPPKAPPSTEQERAKYGNRDVMQSFIVPGYKARNAVLILEDPSLMTHESFSSSYKP